MKSNLSSLAKELAIQRINELKKMIFDMSKSATEEKGRDFHDSLLTELNDKKSQIQRSEQNRLTLNLFDLETLILLILREIPLYKYDKTHFFTHLRESLWEKEFDIIFYFSDQYEYHDQNIMPEKILIGVPSSHLDISIFFPLVFHELGHPYFTGKIFENYTMQTTRNIEEWKTDNSSSTIELTDERVLYSYKDMKYYLQYWPKELFCDLFASCICGTDYLKAFCLYKYDKETSNLEGVHPPDALRLKILNKFFKNNEPNDQENSILEYQSLISTDNSLQHITSVLFSDEMISIFISDFSSFSRFNEVVHYLKKRYKDLKENPLFLKKEMKK